MLFWTRIDKIVNDGGMLKTYLMIMFDTALNVIIIADRQFCLLTLHKKRVEMGVGK